LNLKRLLNLLTNNLKSFNHSVLDFIFPRLCFGCDIEIDKGLICNKCFTQITTTALGTCPICGLPKSFDETCSHPLIHSGVKANALTRIRALGKYVTPYKGLVRNFKYQNKKKIALVLGLGLANLVSSDPILSRADFIVPIPLHPARLRERGYNQSLLLAQETAFSSGVTLKDCLARKKYTRPQIELDYTARAKNISEAYKLKPNLDFSLKDKRVILVDDVVTTGATLAEAAKTLIENGVTEVYGLAVTTARV
jgi:ComF family protein